MHWKVNRKSQKWSPLGENGWKCTIPSQGKSSSINPSLAEHACPVLANSVDPDQLASEDLDQYCLSFSM